MAIDIPNINNRSKATRAKPGSARASVKQLHSVRSASAPVDAVVLTDTTSMLRKAEQMAATMPVTSYAEIAAISDMIDNGNYMVNAQRVAEKIIDFEQQLPS